jgi:hypothetical protein
MIPATKLLRVAAMLAAVWTTVAANFPMDTIMWLLGEVGCC